MCQQMPAVSRKDSPAVRSNQNPNYKPVLFCSLNKLVLKKKWKVIIIVLI